MLICSNRGPYTYEGSADDPIGRRGGGGLIGAIGPVIEGTGGTWIAAPLNDTERELARRDPAGRTDAGFTLRFLDIPADLHHLHYDVVSNEVLWFLLHYLFDVPHAPTFDGIFPKAWEAYERVNDMYATAVAESPSRAVLIQDYHLMLAGRRIRELGRPRRPLIYFQHTPWCEPDYYSLLPDTVGVALLEGLLSHDVIGFHARRWADAFLRCCERFVRGVQVHADEIRWKRRTIKVLVAPVPVDAARLQQEADASNTRSWMESHASMLEGRKLLLRVDRIDLSKNPLRGFLAFEHLLDRRPELANEVLFLALLYPSRLTLERYQNYYSECLGVVRRVNDRFEQNVDADVGPIHLLFEDDFQRSLAAMKLYDVLLVNPVFDGLNLVSKEGAVVNERSGALVLSSNAGSFEELGTAAVPVDPFDVPATASAIETALELNGIERERRATKLRRLATRSTPAEWLEAQLAAAGL